MWLTCNFDPIPDPERDVHLTEMSVEYLVSYAVFICHAISLHSQSIHNIPKQKYVKNYLYEQRYRPLQLQICIDIREKCKLQMILNWWKIK